MAVTVDEFLASVKRLVTVPNNQSLLLNSDFLAFGDRKMRDTMIPLIDGVNQDFFVARTTIALENDVSEYRIPSRSFGRKLREIKLIDPSGGRRDFPLIAIERQQYYQPRGNPWGFHFLGDRVQIVPTPNIVDNSYSIEMWWFLKPGKMLLTSDAARVASVNGVTVTVDSVPSNITTGTVIDFVQGTSGCPYLAIDKEVTNVAGSTLTFAADTIPSDLTEGDYICIAGYSPVLQIPDEAAPYLETLVGMEVLQSIGDFDGMERLSGQAKEQKRNLLMLLEPRIEGEPQVIVNDYGFNRRGWRGIGYGWGFY